mmetsp:Transcript_14144/g.18906  ORF Transcript_14144/g.18906 Transcript_14144/m.18906 type:complete len:328 (-) Transcript_14144:376-1359(-)
MSWRRVATRFQQKSTFATLAPRDVNIRVQAAALEGAVGGFGIVESCGSKVNGLNTNDKVYIKKISKKAMLEPSVAIESDLCMKLPSEIRPEVGALFGAACAADRLLASSVAGDTVIHLGGDSALGQCLAQFARQRNIQLISLVSPEVPEYEQTIELLKNLGALLAAPLDYALTPAFRQIIAQDLDLASLLIIDMTYIDSQAVNTILAATNNGSISSIRSVLQTADPRDIHDAKRINALVAASTPGAAFYTYSANSATPIRGSAPFFPEDALAHADTIQRVSQATDSLAVFVEAYDASTIETAHMRISSGVYKHPYRTPLFVTEIDED